MVAQQEKWQSSLLWLIGEWIELPNQLLVCLNLCGSYDTEGVYLHNRWRMEGAFGLVNGTTPLRDPYITVSVWCFCILIGAVWQETLLRFS